MATFSSRNRRRRLHHQPAVVGFEAASRCEKSIGALVVIEGEKSRIIPNANTRGKASMAGVKRNAGARYHTSSSYAPPTRLRGMHVLYENRRPTAGHGQRKLIGLISLGDR